MSVDGAAFNVREGNNSIDVVATYIPQPRFNSFVQPAGDYRDADIVAGWAASNPDTKAWIAGEFAFGNGFLERLEHRQQYKLNGQREYHLGCHDLTLFGIGYYGFSYIPGLIPIGTPVPGDTIDNRLRNITHTVLLIASDNWKLSQQRQFSFSGFYWFPFFGNLGISEISERSRNIEFTDTRKPLPTVASHRATAPPSGNGHAAPRLADRLPDFSEP